MTSKEHSDIVKILNNVSDKIVSLKQTSQDSWDNDLDKTNQLLRGIYMGKKSAYEDCYNLIRTEANNNYSKRGLDKKIISLLENIKMVVGNITEENKEKSTTIINIFIGEIKSMVDNINNETAGE